MSTASERLPRIFRVRCRFERPRVDDVAQAVREEVARLGLDQTLQPGDRVAITAGSRGIRDIVTVLKTLVDELQRRQARPFLVPAMGSHGGGTAEGQMAVLKALGITEATCGCPILASMETDVVAQSPQGFPIHFDRAARQADHVIVCNRVKPHTTFEGSLESGLAKMLLIGLGKQAGARIYHRAILDHRFEAIVRGVAEAVIRTCRIAGGLAIIENAYHETAHIEAIRPEALLQREAQLLKRARALMPRLPFPVLDFLLVDRIGKDISGTGLDTNIVGRKEDPSLFARPDQPAARPDVRIRYIGVRDLTPRTGGNAAGIGLVELCRRRVLEKTDWSVTRNNALTAVHLRGAMQPVPFDTDRELIETALQSAGLAPPFAARMLWIRDTASVTEVECSECFWDEARERGDLDVCTPRRALPFAPSGNLPDDWWQHDARCP